MREEGRERNESFVAVGSTRNCWLRKESRPGIGAEMVVVMKKRTRRKTAAMTVVGGISDCLGIRWGIGFGGFEQNVMCCWFS